MQTQLFDYKNNTGFAFSIINTCNQLLFLLAMLIKVNAYAQTQPPPLKWKKTYPLNQNGGYRINDFTYLKSNHSYYALGQLDLADCVNNICQCDIYTDNDTTHNGQVLYQLDETGNIIKKICLGKIFAGYRFITTSIDNQLVIAGTASKPVGEFTGYNIDTVTHDVIVIKMDSLGNIIWRTHLPGYGYDELNNIYSADNNHVFVLVNRWADPDGIYYEHYGEPNSFDEDSYVIELDENGNIIWSKAIGGTKLEVLMSIIRLPNNDIIVGGIIESSSIGYYASSIPMGAGDAYVVYIDSARNMKWNKRFGGSSVDALRVIISISDDKILLITAIGYGSTNTDIPLWHTPSEIAAYIINGNGDILKSRTYGGNDYDNCCFPKYKIFKSGNHIAIYGTTASKDGDVLPMYPLLPKATPWLLIIDTALNIVNSYNLGGKSENWNDELLSYYYDGDHLTAASVFMGSCPALQIPHNPWGTTVMYDINQYTLVSELELTPVMVKVIPNPVRQKAIVEIEGDKMNAAKWLSVYDINGQVVLNERINSTLEQIDVSSMPSGTYFYEVLTELRQKLFIGKIIILH